MVAHKYNPILQMEKTEAQRVDLINTGSTAKQNR